MNLENITKMLHPGEQILWASMPQPGKLMDEQNKKRNMRWFITVGVVFAVLMFLYVRACVGAGTNVFSVVTVLFVLVAALIFLDPITTYRMLRKVEYHNRARDRLLAFNTELFSSPFQGRSRADH